MIEPSAAAVTPLAHLGYLTVTGSDATKFLHAQFTNDLQSMTAGHWQYTGYCTPKGRLLAFMVALRRAENDYRLIVDQSVIDMFLPRLRMFVLRDDVAIAPGTGSILGVFDEIPRDWLADLNRPTDAGEAACSGQHSLLKIDDRRFLYIDESGQVQVEQASEANWIRQDIVSGIPSITSETQEAFVPQMVNLDLIGAVNFKKGCYPGQEVVARVHYLGKTKQRMFVLRLESGEPVASGAKIFSPRQPDKAAGTVVRAVATDGVSMLLAVLQTTTTVDGAELHLADPDGPELSLAELPYPIPELEPAAEENED